MERIGQYLVALLLGAVSGSETTVLAQTGAVSNGLPRAGVALNPTSADEWKVGTRVGVDGPKPQPVGSPAPPVEVISWNGSSAPLITGQPVSQSVPASRYIFLSVNAVGAPPLNYQWQSNGVNLLNATNQVLCVRAVGVSNAPEFQVLVSNAVGSVTSTVARATVLGAAQERRPDPPRFLQILGPKK